MRVKPSQAEERILRIIHLCREVEAKGFNPFEVDVAGELEVLRRLLPGWVKPSELTLDGEALRGLARVVELQDEWVRARSRLRILDPETVRERVAELTIPQLAEAFLKAWRPTVRIEVLTGERLREAASYWVRLKPKSRLPEPPALKEGEAEASGEALKSLGLSLSEDFRGMLEETFRQLKAEAERAGGEIPYWNFVRAGSFRETVARAYLVSFLATYGYAEIVEDRLAGSLRLKPTPGRAERLGGGYSIAIPLDRGGVRPG